MIEEEKLMDILDPFLNENNEISKSEYEELFSDLEPDELRQLKKIFSKNEIKIVTKKDPAFDKNADSDDELISDGVQIFSPENSWLLKCSNQELCVLYQKGNREALAALMYKNKNLVYHVALKIMNLFSRSSYSIHDFYIAGNMGIAEAAARFDASLGYSFTTYAVWWIKQQMYRSAMNEGYLIRLPVHVFEKIRKINRFRQKHPEISDDQDLYKTWLEEGEEEIPWDKFSWYITLESNYINTSSLNKLASEDNATEITDLIPDEKAKCVEDLLDYEFLKESIADMLSDLTERERYIITLRYGLDGNEPRTLEEVGEEIGVTRERVRQIEKKAITKMKNSKHKGGLKAYLYKN